MPFENRYALVTGASRGIGYAVAKSLALQGAHVIAIARTQGGLTALDDEIKKHNDYNDSLKITLAVCDLCDINALNDLIAKTRERFGQLDILFGNAAMLGTLTPVSHLSPADLQRLFTLNFFVNQRLIAGFEDLLQASPNGRALFMTSPIAQSPRGFWGGYGASKAALENLVLAWAEEMRNTQLRINLFNPNATATRMWQEAYPGGDITKLPSPNTIAKQILPYLNDNNTTHAQIINASP